MDYVPEYNSNTSPVSRAYIRHGVDFEDGKPFLQVMPWPFFKDMTDRELHAIYEYLRAIPCVARPDQSPSRCGL